MDDERKRKLERRRALLIRRNELLAQREDQGSPQKKESWFNKGINKINEIGDTHLAPIPVGLLQGGMDTANFFSNLIPGALGLETIPRTNLADVFLKPGYNKSSHFIGEFGPLIASLMAATPKVSQKASELGGKLSTGLSSKKTGESLLAKYLGNEKQSAHLFEDLFKKSSEKGASSLDINIPEKDLSKLKKIVSPDVIEKFMEHKTPEAGHFLRSALNKYARGVETKGTSAHPAYGIRAQKAREYAKKLLDSINESLLKAGDEYPELYTGARGHFKENVAPFRNVTGDYFSKAALEPGSKGYIYPKRLPGKALEQSGDPLTSSLMGQMPELETYRKLHSPMAKWGAGTVMAGALGTALKKALFEQ